MKIGIMGGTFNPIHNGHLMLGEYACKQFGLQEIWFLPNGNPPHKQGDRIESNLFRKEMVALAIEGHPNFRLEEYEICRNDVSYSYETMEHFTRQYPNDDFYFIIGADSLFAIETWKRPERLLSVCKVLAAFRDDRNERSVMEKQIEMLNKKYGSDIRLLITPLIPISSTGIRELIRKDGSVADILPKPVESYIRAHHLYEESDGV